MAGTRASKAVEDSAPLTPEAVFSPRISARRLEELAASRPRLAALCAMHPNGADIQIPNTDPKAAIVRDFQAKFSPVALAGKAVGAAPSPAQSIEL